MTTAANARELFDLTSDYCDGIISADRLQRLEVLLSNVEERWQFRALMEQHAILQQEFLDAGAENELTSLHLELPAVPRSLTLWWRSTSELIKQPRALSAIISLLVMSVVLLLMAQWNAPAWKPSPQGGEGSSTRFVASISSTSEAVFDNTSGANLTNRSLCDDDKVVLNSGLAVIQYKSGARVVLQGSASYCIQGANGGELQLGKLLARADTVESHGFTVTVPGGRIVDRGTEFGVGVTAAGFSDVAVLAGEVEVISQSGSGAAANRAQLTKGQAATVTAGGAVARRDFGNERRITEFRTQLRSALTPPKNGIANGGFELPTTMTSDNRVAQWFEEQDLGEPRAWGGFVRDIVKCCGWEFFSRRLV